jgi:methylamine dehydrogenase accessory protein MauD
VRGWWLVSYVVMWILLLSVAIIGLAILRQLGLIWVRLGGALGALQTPEGPEIGGHIPVVEVLDDVGIGRSLVAEPGRLKLLLFLSPTCEVCDPMIPMIPGFVRRIRDEADLIALLTARDDNGKLAGWRVSGPPIVTDAGVQDVWTLPGLPYALAVDDRGRVVSKGIVDDVLQLESVLNGGLEYLRQEPGSREEKQSLSIA